MLKLHACLLANHIPLPNSYQQAQAYWRAEAPFRGVPFKPGLGKDEIATILKIFRMDGLNCESAVNVFFFLLFFCNTFMRDEFLKHIRAYIFEVLQPWCGYS